MVKKRMDSENWVNKKAFIISMIGLAFILFICFLLLFGSIIIAKNFSKNNLKGGLGTVGVFSGQGTSSNGLVAYYPLNGNANDMSGNGNDGVVNGGVRFVNDISKGMVASFNGIDGYINLSKKDIWNFKNSYSISFWYKLNAPVNVSTNYEILTNENYFANPPYGTIIRVEGSNLVVVFRTSYLNSSGGAAHDVRQTGALANSTWNSITFVKDSGYLKIYVNGKIVGSSLISDSYDSQQDLVIGGNGQFFKGYIDDLKIWNVSLSDSDVLNEYNSYKRLVAYYPFNGNASDASGNGNDGIAYGATPISGKIGQGYSFNGSGQFMITPIISLPSDFSISFWEYFPLGHIVTNYDAVVGKISDNDINHYNGNIRLWNGTQDLIVSDKITPTGQWVYYTFTRNGTNYSIWKDGYLEKSVSATIFNFNISSIGAGYNGLANTFNGSIDEVKIWNYALNSSDVLDEYDKGARQLVAYYPFEGNANDTSGNGNNGVNNGATPTFGKIGKGYSFNGNSSYINISNNPTLDGYPQMTVGFWTKYPEPTINYPVFLSKQKDSWGSFYSHVLGPIYSENKSKIVFFWFNQTNRNNLYSISKPSFDTWHYFTSVYDSIKGSADLYIDGKLDNSIPVSGNINVAPYNLLIGTGGNIASYEMFNGSIDEVKIWNYALNSSDVLDEYDKGARQLVAYYPFEGNANDASGNGNNGFVNGTTPTSGRIGQGYSFNGVNNYIDIPNLSANSLDDFTVSAWVKPNNIIYEPNIIYADNNSGVYPYQFRMTYYYVNNKMYSYVFDTSSNITASQGGVVNVNQWNHFLFEYNRTGPLKIYLNGVKVGESGNAFGLSPLRKVNSYIRIGAGILAGGTYAGGVNGTIDEVKIWNYDLNDSEILNEYNRRAGQLVAYYPFDGNASDESGNGNDGVNNGATPTKGVSGQAYSFNGINSEISKTYPNNLPEGNSARTISAWVKINEKNTTIYGDELVGYGNDNNDNNGFTICYRKNYSSHPDGLFINNLYGTTPWFNTNFTLNKDTWYHVAASFDGINNISVYVNGVIIASGNRIYNTTAGYIKIGHFGTYLGNYLNGSIDEVKIWNYSLDASDIQNEYNSYNRLIAYYPFEGNANDTSGNGNNGVVNGTTPTSGRIGQGYSFNGVNNYIDLGNSSLLKIKDNLTISAWVYYLGGRTDEVIIRSGAYADMVYGLFAYGLQNYYNGTAGETLENIIPTNKWTHIVAIRSIPNSYLYINGVLVNSSSSWGKVPDDINPSSTRIGGSGSIQQFFNGSIDEVKVWNYPLNSSEVLDEYNSYKKLVAYYPFEGNANDLSEFKNNGIDPPMIDDFEDGDYNGWSASCGASILDIVSPGYLSNYAIRVNSSADLGCARKYLNVTKGQQISYACKGYGCYLCVYNGTEYINDNNICPGHGYINDWTTFTTTVTSSQGNVGFYLYNDATAGHAAYYDDITFGPIPANGKIGQAYSFNGNGNIAVPYSPFLDLSDTLSVSAWVKLGNITSSNADSVIVLKNYEYGLTRDERDSYWTSNKNIWAYINGGGNFLNVTLPNFNIWYNIILTYDKYKMNLYLDGSLVSTKPYTDTINITNFPLLIGDGFHGSIDNVRIWNYGLNSSEVLNEYNSYKKLVAYYPFEGNANDASGNGNDGNTNDVVSTSGKFGQAYSFNGINSYIQVPDNSYLNLNQNGGTVSAWIKTSSTEAQPIVSKTYGYSDGYWLEKLTNTTRVSVFTSPYTCCPNPNEANAIGARITNDNDWHYIVGIWNNSGVNLYVDGKIDASTPYSFNFTTAYAYPLFIGRTNNPGDRFFNGSIDEVKIWNYALNDSEIRYNYNCSYSCLGTTPKCNIDTSQCVQCLSNDDCSSGQTCNSDGQCVSGSTGPGGGGGSGDGGGGGAPSKKCIENWSCSGWGECIDGTQTRTCSDINKCKTSLNKPETSMVCTTKPDENLSQNKTITPEITKPVSIIQILRDNILIIFIVIIGIGIIISIILIRIILRKRRINKLKKEIEGKKTEIKQTSPLKKEIEHKKIEPKSKPLLSEENNRKKDKIDSKKIIQKKPTILPPKPENKSLVDKNKKINLSSPKRNIQVPPKVLESKKVPEVVGNLKENPPDKIYLPRPVTSESKPKIITPEVTTKPILPTKPITIPDVVSESKPKIDSPKVIPPPKDNVESTNKAENKETSSDSYEKRKLVIRGIMLARDARGMGMDDKQIWKLFKDKNWDDKDIKEIIEKSR